MTVSYLTPPELVRRALIATAEIMDVELTPSDRDAAFALDHAVVERVMAEHRDLCPNGFWAPGCLSPEEFSAGRARMLDRHHLGQFERGLAFLLLCCGRRKTVNRRVTSYGLKHSAERAMRGLGVADPYVSNGMFMAAAIALGFRVERIQGTPNAWLGLTVVRERCK